MVVAIEEKKLSLIYTHKKREREEREREREREKIPLFKIFL